LNLRDKAVQLKPKQVEYIPGAEVNTNPLLVGARPALFSRSARTEFGCAGRGHLGNTGHTARLS
jgi:hypothetical protein